MPVATLGLRHRTKSGIELAVWKWAGSRPPAFLLVHGLASNARLWDGVAGCLSASGYPCVTVDQRGHGRSDRPSGGYDFATLATDLAGVLENHVDPPVVAVGQSWGGNVVVELAVRYPELLIGVACVEGGYIDLSATHPDLDSAVRTLTPPELPAVTREAAEAAMADFYPGFPREGLMAQLDNLEEGTDGLLRRRLPMEAHLSILGHLWEHRPRELARRVSHPVMVVAATDRLAGPAEQVTAFVANLAHPRLHWVEGHHDLHAQQPEAVAGLLMEAVETGFFS